MEKELADTYTKLYSLYLCIFKYKLQVFSTLHVDFLIRFEFGT